MLHLQYPVEQVLLAGKHEEKVAQGNAVHPVGGYLHGETLDSRCVSHKVAEFYHNGFGDSALLFILGFYCALPSDGQVADFVGKAGGPM